MAKTLFKRFGNPDCLRQISTETLKKLLIPNRSFFKGQGIGLDGKWDEEMINRLANLFAVPPSSIPGELLDALDLLEMLCADDGLAELLAVAPELVKLVKEEGDTAGDIAVKIWLRDPNAVQRAYTKFSLQSSRTLTSYVAKKPFKLLKPNTAICRDMADELGRAFADLFNTSACEIIPFDETSGFGLLIKHGEPPKRLGVWNDHNKTETKSVRPLKHDVGFINSKTGELQISGRSENVKEHYRQVIGQHLFQHRDTLQRFHRFTLTPLLDGRNCLKCPDLDTVSFAALRELQLQHKQRATTTIHRASDVFAEIEALGHGYLDDYHLVKARFSLRVFSRRKALNVAVMPDSDGLGGDSHDPTVLAWLCECKFINVA